MKKILLLALGMIVPGLAFGQGSLYFSLGVGVQTGNGQPGVNAPVFITPVSGGIKTDTSYDFALIGAPQGTGTAANGGVATTVNQNIVNASGYLEAQVSVGGANAIKIGTASGLFSGSATVSIPGAGSSGSIANVQVVVWKSSMGTDWAAAYANWLAHPNDANYMLGVSAVQNVQLGAISDLVQPRLGAQTANGTDLAKYSSTPGIASFAVIESVPEPSVVALAGLGLVGAFMIRRRK